MKPVADNAVIVVADFYPDIAAGLLAECKAVWRAAGVSNIAVHKVPGALEIPLAVQLLAAPEVKLMAALGCVIRGDTYHFEIVSNIVARGILQVQLAKNIPLGNGVLTAETHAQAAARLGKGAQAARAALSLAALAVLR